MQFIIYFLFLAIAIPITENSCQETDKKKMQFTVLTHHKCASDYIRIYLNKICELNNLDLFISEIGKHKPHPNKDITLLLNATYAYLKDEIDVPVIHIIRNPLDLLVSAYYSHLRTHPIDNWPQLEQQRHLLTSSSKELGFFLTIAFIEQEMFYPETPGPLYSLKNWDFDDVRIKTIRMEDLVVDINSILGEILKENIVDLSKLPEQMDFTFEKMSGGRSRGEIDLTSHYRAGQVNCWRDELPDEAIAYIREHYHSLLARYYPDSLE